MIWAGGVLTATICPSPTPCTTNYHRGNENNPNPSDPPKAANAAPINIFLDGKIKMNKSPGNNTIFYAGKMAFVTTGDVKIETSLLPSDINGNPCTADNADECAFPTKNFLSLMVAGVNRKLEIGIDEPNLEDIGIFYTEGKLRILKSTIAAGAVAGQTIEFSTDTAVVPQLFQVPRLLSLLPKSIMPNFGNQSFTVRSVPNTWREVSQPPFKTTF